MLLLPYVANVLA